MVHFRDSPYTTEKREKSRTKNKRRRERLRMKVLYTIHFDLPSLILRPAFFSFFSGIWGISKMDHSSPSVKAVLKVREKKAGRRIREEDRDCE